MCGKGEGARGYGASDLFKEGSRGVRSETGEEGGKFAKGGGGVEASVQM
jgi:hypothetical protein